MAQLITTPFRQHYEHCRTLDLEGQVQECAAHLQHPDVILMEFFESYHQIERTWSPEQDLKPPETDELVLEPFHGSLEVAVEGAAGERERFVCLSGSVSPIADEVHPAISHRGLDYIALQAAERPRLILGAAQSWADETPYLLLLRALNCLAELSPPLRVSQLAQQLLGHQLDERTRFDLHLVLDGSASGGVMRSLGQLSQDLADVFIRQVAAYPQFEGTLGRVACLETAPPDPDGGMVMRTVWEV